MWASSASVPTGGSPCNRGRRRRFRRSVSAEVRTRSARAGPGDPGVKGGSGGGVYNTGSLTLVDTTVVSNVAGVGGPTADGGDGGGIANAGGGTVTLVRSTLTNNFSGRGGAGGVGGDGGAIFTSDATTTATNVTIASNAAAAGGSGGAALVAGVAGRLTLDHATVAGNRLTAGGIGAAILVSGGIGTARSSIFADNGCRSMTAQGANISYPDGSCPGFYGDPRLAPLAFNGGPTMTMGLRPGSAALDMVPVDTCPTSDQRGIARPVGPACDIGAFEGQLRTLSPPPAGSLSRPTATFRLAKRRLSLRYTVSGPGRLVVAVFAKRRIGRATRHPAAAGRITVRVKLARTAIRKLKARGKLRVRTKATFTPAGGKAIVVTKRLTLRKRHR